jgi:hypothetical protein
VCERERERERDLPSSWRPPWLGALDERITAQHEEPKRSNAAKEPKSGSEGTRLYRDVD